jgi:hypothetical protein
MVRLRMVLAIVAAAALPSFARAEPRIVEPAAGATIHSNSGVIHVIVTGVPPGDSVLPVLDGKAAQVYYATPEFDLRDVSRGAHHLAVRILGPREFQVGLAGPVDFQVWHASRLNRHEQ